MENKEQTYYVAFWGTSLQCNLLAESEEFLIATLIEEYDFKDEDHVRSVYSFRPVKLTFLDE